MKTDDPIFMQHWLSIDWDGLRAHPWHRNPGEDGPKEDSSFWDQRAPDFAAKAHSPETREANLRFLERFPWDPEETVLDVGAGPGTFAIPLAERVRRVTACDASAGMLEQLRLQAQREGVDERITTVQGRWVSSPLPEPHDTVVCFNALGVVTLDEMGVPHLDRALERFRLLARKRLLILIPHAGSPVGEDLAAHLGLPPSTLAPTRVAALFNFLFAQGMLCSLELLYRPFDWIFESVEEGVEVLAGRAGITDEAVRRELGRFVDERSRRIDGRLLLTTRAVQALFRWER